MADANMTLSQLMIFNYPSPTQVENIFHLSCGDTTFDSFGQSQIRSGGSCDQIGVCDNNSPNRTRTANERSKLAAVFFLMLPAFHIVFSDVFGTKDLPTGS